MQQPKPLHAVSTKPHLPSTVNVQGSETAKKKALLRACEISQYLTSLRRKKILTHVF